MKFGKHMYALLFCAVIPAGLAAWGMFTAAAPPGVRWPSSGTALLLTGVVLMAWAMLELWRKARALPMNAFPPTRRVETGPFAIVDHPIYLGFVLACAGASLISGIGGALWLVTPVTALGCAALVMGYEYRASEHRLGQRQSRPALSLAPANNDSPGFGARVSCWFVILVPWVVLYEAIGHLPTPGASSVVLPFERGAPVQVWTEAFYALAYPFAMLAPLLAARSSDLRRFQTSAIAAMLLGFLCYLAIPVISPPRDFDTSGPLGWLLSVERADGLAGRAAMPSFHVYWALTSAWLIGRRGTRWRALAWTFAIAIIASCWTTGMHALLDLAGGVALFLVGHYHNALSRAAVRLGERVANTWCELRLGPVRVLVHALYAGLAAGVGTLLACVLLPHDLHAWFAVIALAGLIGAAIWGQFMEGGGRLSRPFGYFGHVLGSALALGAAAIARGAETWIIAAALATAGPLIQSIGRLRCLVQGCCHGERSRDGEGVRYHMPLSRVCALAGWRGQALVPTPVWSIVTGIGIFGLLWRLWGAHVPASMIVGLYLVLTGLTRFVEEHYRGEPQTKVLAGLRSYQWMSIAMFVLGAICTCLRSPLALPADRATPGVWMFALGLAMAYAFAMGVDFPHSGRRLSLLVPTADSPSCA